MHSNSIINSFPIHADLYIRWSKGLEKKEKIILTFSDLRMNKRVIFCPYISANTCPAPGGSIKVNLLYLSIDFPVINDLVH